MVNTHPSEYQYIERLLGLEPKFLGEPLEDDGFFDALASGTYVAPDADTFFSIQNVRSWYVEISPFKEAIKGAFFARISLRQTYGVDFCFSLQAWHDFLLKSCEDYHSGITNKEDLSYFHRFVESEFEAIRVSKLEKSAPRLWNCLETKDMLEMFIDTYFSGMN